MSLWSRIRGGRDYLTDRVATAAQFLTLRLIPIGSTYMGCDDSDGPGHAPRYLYVRPKMNPHDARTVEELIQSCHSGDRPKFVFFWGHTAASDSQIGKECFSQWYYSPFTIDGITYPTSEHYMMAQKALLFGDMVSHDKIIKAASPSMVKALGREVLGFNEDIWTKNAYRIVVDGNTAKFSQNILLKEVILGTGSRVLVEASPRDRIWGIGLSQDDQYAEQPLKWKGENKLGFALMEVRSKLRSA